MLCEGRISTADWAPQVLDPCEALAETLFRGRCAERMVLGEGRISTAGRRDFDSANNIAREMVYRCGFSRRLGPVALMSSEERFLHDARTRGVANISSELARIAMADIRDVRPGHDKGPLQS